ncbi:MAG: D-aminoacyl-tRNA deacylase [Clostridia bacterium]|jgi:D-tyrosyl-tRNA(Tyr) deacylase|nr:d-tyrosyl-tRNA(Tyr) deacylase [Clostridium sp. CAG:571]HJJ14689.1 D-aminoacyl-tRNA deacylase [Clostridiaceae bacterium]
MKLVVQRVKNANVSIENNIVGKINQGFVVLLGVSNEDTKENADYLVKKLLNLRVFSDNDDKMNLSIKDIEGELLIVSQFTLYANCKKGNRPSFIEAAKPEHAKPLYEYFINECRKENLNVQTGEFGADMQIELINDGPVTILLEN